MSKIYSIYQIVNINTGVIYIGQTANLTKRLTEHRYLLKKNKHPNNHLQRSYNIHGSNAFEYRKIMDCQKDELTKAEEYWINYYKNTGDMFNQRNNCSSNLGWIMSQETKQKISSKNSLSMKGNKNGAGNKGRNFSKETREKMSRAHAGKPRPWRVGIKPSVETRRKISETLKAKFTGVSFQLSGQENLV